MFDFVRKMEIWDACDKGYLDELESKKISYQLKIAQDLAVYRHVRDLTGLDIGEIGGGNSRVLERLAKKNRCFNIEKFEGRDLGPAGSIALEGVKNINAYVGDFDALLPDESFDLVFSISVVEHVETASLDAFFQDSLRILRRGGRFLHAIDMYVQDEPKAYAQDRYERYRKWCAETRGVEPLGAVFAGQMAFSTDMISNPDNILYGWNSLVPALKAVRTVSQNLSLLVGGRKI
jgi:SAM-dependent methyltransferase